MLATGFGKAEAVAEMVTGRVGPSLPASLLHQHQQFTMVIDRHAAGKLPEDVKAEAR